MDDYISRETARGNMRIKGKYVAQIVMDIDYPDTKEFRPFEEVRNDLTTGVLTGAIQGLLEDEIDFPSNMKLIVTQQYADLYRVEEETE